MLLQNLWIFFKIAETFNESTFETQWEIFNDKLWRCFQELWNYFIKKKICSN